MMSEDLIASLLYRDGLMLVVNKPAGVPVHRGPKGGPNLEDGFDSLRFGLPRPPALAHRLDRDTSGCLVLGRHRKALAKLGLLFKQGKIDKTYWAVVEGGPAEADGLIDLPLGRLDATRGWWMKVDPLGAPSQTVWRVMGRDAGLCWLALSPLTGRTHQLRVHCAAMGWPILGDAVYGSVGKSEASMHLHARAISIPISANKPPIEVEAPVPPHMGEALQRCGWGGEVAADIVRADA
ncbi:RluA family pseudouridine synthase [Lichenihabitans psoromatis]|uniref:RluA family pseudouridine synthase n=1 Tax=Lichenihabitans psoromatis TaxID=2528642 RepID=UPI00103645A9|nr:RNA pseudouridine synthase [Lichenihabitans psoromatis]